ncbi:MAG: polysaccharide biosynthesis protein [Bdellovibrionaceae bacterium]|jgi:FlaA1/EpsC-like NDP-sugar epimerase|nr:polysaccharide biosynthesis protein [Pseudobdellovibrionaceae bacterium]
MNKTILWLKQIISVRVLSDTLLIIFSLYASLYLRLGSVEIHEHLPVMNNWLPIFVIIRIGFLFNFGCYHVIWRYITSSDVVKLLKPVLLSSALIMSIAYFLPELGRLPRSFFIIDSILVTLFLTGIRLFWRIYNEGKGTTPHGTGSITLIYGAGKNGRTLLQRFQNDSSTTLDVIGFIDDDPKKIGRVISGINVLGCKEDLPKLIQTHNVKQLIISLPHLPGIKIREIIKITRPFNIKPHITTKLTHREKADMSVDIHRKIELRDLLSRPQREINLSSIKQLIKGKRILVTGAGGSIGSELARQIFNSEPSRLLLLDHSEYNLYKIDKELRLATHDTSTVVPLLIDLKNEKTLSSAFNEFSPEIVFHAAAYKHVHLVEANPYPSILNNVEGTKNLLNASQDVNVNTFVLISSDKAVNPAGVMGATKRVCELLTTDFAKKTGQNYVSVRFGNVLGSSGSLIPLLQQQVKAGGPVTITHQDMTRYFMLIPEAVSLVLKAATIARPGDINVLKMGDPIKILSIAQSLIALMGKTEEEISIIFTGLRPGEKIFEELYIRGDELKTEHPDILTIPNGDSDVFLSSTKRKILMNQIENIIEQANNSTKDAVFTLNEVVNSNYIAPKLEQDKPTDISIVTSN